MVWGMFSWYTLAQTEYRLKPTAFLRLAADNLHPFMPIV